MNSGAGIKAWFLENVVLKAGDLALGSELVSQLKVQRTYSQLNGNQLEALQLQKLKSLLQHATTTCTAYQPYAGPEQQDVKKWLSAFPVLSKREIVKNTDAYISSKFQKEKLIKYESSGSSGIRSLVYMDAREQSIIRAILIHWWEWNGYYLGKPVFQNGITPDRGVVKRLKDFFLSTIYMNAFYLSEKEILEKLALVKQKGSENMILFGYASTLYEIAKVARKHQLKMRFDLAMSQGDKLFEHYQKEIQEVFDCKVVEDYGMNEGIMVGQKADLPWFYVYTPNVYLEILDEHDQPVKDGTMGRIIVTKLDGLAMPLIRYETGDLGIMLPAEKYPANRNFAFPLLEKVVGRNTDIIKDAEGLIFVVHVFTGIFEFYPEIAQFQVVQHRENEMTIRYIPAENFHPQVLTAIEADLREKTKSKIEVKWEAVSEIKPSKSGKPQVIVNYMLPNPLSDLTT